jgi:mycofactocin system glycosyltransferase
LALLERAVGGLSEPVGSGEERALESLVRRGFAERDGVPAFPADRAPSVSVVIPARDRAEELRRCLGALRGLDYPLEKVEVIVVDDGSRDATVQVARESGALVVDSGGFGRGPGAARNRGAAEASGDLLAFVDSDCVASAGWLAELVGWFRSSEVVAVGGLVEGLRTAAPLDRYEAAMSSLTLGRREKTGAGGNDTFYLPSCNLLVRREAFGRAGGFRPELHVGEDVDLSWRLRDAGGTLVYSPAGAVCHEHRSRLLAFACRRFEYGTSEGALQVLHPARHKRLVVPRSLGLAAGLLAASVLFGLLPLSLLAAVLLAWDAGAFRRRLSRTGLVFGYGQVLAARARALGSLFYYLGYHAARYYGLPLLAASLLWPRFGALAAGLAVSTAAVDHAVRRPQLTFPVFLAYYLCEHLAYGLGAFWGCWRKRSFVSYRPVFLGRVEVQTG